MDDNKVAGYLSMHPEFFERHADLLAQLIIPDPHNGQAISITERQIAALREKSRQLEAKLAELIRFGEENDAISDKMHYLALALMGAGDFASVLRALYSHLGGAFAVPHVALRLWDVAVVDGLADQAEFAAVSGEAKSFATALSRPYCGPGGGLEIPSWFGERGAQVRSLALMPLKRGNETIGLLALGSEETQRFYPEMGALFLVRIGDMAGAALLRALRK